MKIKNLFILMVIAFFISCSAGSESTDNSLGEDIVNDEVVSDNTADEFNFNTVSSMQVKLKIKDEHGQPIKNAIVTVQQSDIVTKSTGFDATKNICQTRTDDNGVVDFNMPTNLSKSSLDIYIWHADYDERVVNVNNYTELATINRQLVLESSTSTTTVQDSDNDGIPNKYDQLFDPDPVDGLNIFQSCQYIMAYEDLYPSKGDADFNDVVVMVAMYILSDYYGTCLIGTDVKYKILAVGAGYDDVALQHLDIYELHKANSEIVKVDLANPVKGTLVGNSINTISGNPFEDFAVGEISNKFPIKLPIGTLIKLPFDIHITINEPLGSGLNNNGTASLTDEEIALYTAIGREAHLPFIDVNYAGKLNDQDGFPWALCIPVDLNSPWKWPLEGEKIETAYPNFKNWYMSNGQQDKDWFNHPAIDKVYNDCPALENLLTIGPTVPLQ